MTLPVFLASFFKRLFWALIPLTAWADLAEMSLDEKIGQLFVMPACPKRGAEHFEDLCTLIHECHVGSVIIKQSDPLTQVAFLNRLQSVSDHRLLVMADAEWGLAMRMADTMAFPRNMTLGAIQDLSLLKELGAEIGRQARLVGIDMNLAPVADVNTNPLNPIIGMRSFGEDPSHVADCVLAISAGMQSAGLLTCVKHFPGHGDTLVDSHKDLPIVHDLMGGLFPFQRAFAAGVDAVMTAHLYVPVIDPIWPTSLSLACLHMIKDCGFEGLIISDALNMGALRRYSPEEVAIRARAAGCDLLLYGDHIAPNVDEILRETIPRAFAALKRGYLSGELDLAELDQTVRKILDRKKRLPVVAVGDSLLESLHSADALALKQRLFQEACSWVGDAWIPDLATTAYLSFGEGDILAEHFGQLSPEEASCVVIAIHQKEALTPEAIAQIAQYQDRSILCHFATPYALKGLKSKTVLLGYENDPMAQRAALNILLGKQIAKGSPPLKIAFK